MAGRSPAIRAASALLVALALAGCAPEPELVVRDAWIRAVPPGGSATAGYLVLENHGTSERVLTGVTAASIPRVEIHTTNMENGVMRMRRLERLPVPAGGEVALTPGGRHLMLFADPLPVAGTVVTLELRFADGETLTLEAPVRRGGED